MLFQQRKIKLNFRSSFINIRLLRIIQNLPIILLQYLLQRKTRRIFTSNLQIQQKRLIIPTITSLTRLHRLLIHKLIQMLILSNPLKIFLLADRPSPWNPVAYLESMSIKILYLIYCQN